MTRAIIIGGGLAGPLTALALERVGVECTVFEARPEGGAVDVGAWLTVAVNGLSAMRRLGIADAVRACGFPSRDVVLASGSGKTLGTVPIGGVLPDGTTTHTMKRADLHACLLDQLGRRGIPVVYDARFDGLEQRDGGVRAHFEGRSAADAELLVGADGIRSAVRSAIDPRSKPPRYTGLGNVGGFTPASAVNLPRGTYRMIFGRRAFFGYTTTPDGETWWFANPPRAKPIPREELAAMDTAAWKARLVGLFEGDVGPMRELVEGSVGELVGMNQFDLDPVPTWHRGRAVVLGDAAHAASPSSGQGVSMAAEDAVALANCLRDGGPDVSPALDRFVALRAPRAAEVMAYGRRFANEKAAGPIGRVLRDLFLPFALRSLSGDAEGRRMAWLYDHDLDPTRPGADS